MHFQSEWGTAVATHLVYGMALLHKGVAEGTAQVSLNRDKQHKPKACPRLVPI